MSENENDQLSAIRHSLAHLLAATVVEMYPGAKNAIGPAIDNGFYEDFEMPQPLSEDELPKIEAAMRKKLATWQGFERREVSREEALKEFEWNPYKQELINDFAQDGQQLTFYVSGDFIDLCRGGHVEDIKSIKPDAFKLSHLAGAYWKGNEKNKMLTRIYGFAFESKKELEDYLKFREEAKKRDHRKLGQELDLFTFSDLVGAGLPLYTPRGTVIIEELKNALRDISKQHGSQLVSIPHLAKIELYKISGHADKFADELFHVKSHYDQEFVMKPVNCPHHIQIYAARPRSYKELPLRYIEQTMQYRDEKPGQIGGLQRTRGFTVDDGHTFCRVDQIESEADSLVDVIRQFYTSLGLWGKHWVSLSVRDPKTPDKYIGEPSDWDKAEEMLSKVCEVQELNAKRMEGEAALYGPKIDFMFQDALGRETQLATVQIDFAMPKRFGISYTGEKGDSETPVIIHRAILGSFERFMMLLIEHFAGKFPLWLSPEQLRVITVNQEPKTVEFADKILQKAREMDLRVYVDNDNESVGKKIRNAELMKVPYAVVIGEKEIESGKLTARVRSDIAVNDEHPAVEIDHFLQTISNEVKTRATKTSL
jgi:threonyl-tRNA synthetase